jgi:subtilisin family serine protease
MKNKLLLFIAILLVFFACTTDDTQFLENDETTVLQNNQNRNYEESEVVASFEDSPNTQVTPLNEIIIKYQPGVSEDDKEALKEEFKVVSSKRCDCTDGGQAYELWVMQDGIDIEPTVSVIKRKKRKEVLLVSQNKGYNIPMNAITSESEENTDQVYIEGGSDLDYFDRIVSSNIGVTIAILDTGIDTDQVGFSGSFLYNSSQNGLCNEESGRDFVNNDNIPYDDDIFKHGTIAAYIVHKNLVGRIDHQILPVKIANAYGNSTYFDTLCGLRYAIEKESDVINMSFGWTDPNQDIYNLFSDLIDTTDAILVTSAGNDDDDNDIKPHYPSNFPQNHVLAVAAAKDNLNDAALYSNFGKTTVDFYAVGNKIPFPLRTPNNFVNANGTSFAAPLIAARVAELISNNLKDIRVELSKQFGTTINYSKPVFYSKRID